MEKVIKDGKVAVLISVGWGAGWSTWNGLYSDTLLFHPTLVNMVLEGRQNEITSELVSKLAGTNESIYVGGAEDLEVVWIEQGTSFKVEENDGNESIIYPSDLTHEA